MSAKGKTAWAIAGFMLMAAMTGTIWFYSSGFTLKEPTYIFIDRDDNIDSVSHKIAKDCKPQSIRAFRLYSMLFKLEKRIRTGKYEVRPDMKMMELVRDIRNHNERPIKIIIPPVRTVNEMVRRIAPQLMIDSMEIVEYINDTTNLRQMGCSKETLPSLFIPNTYEVYWDITVQDLFARLQKENDAFWNEKRLAKLQEVSLYAGEEMTKEKVSTLASIIDSETANNPEKPNIASLYLNRLRLGMPLQSDPTIKFALQDFTLKRILYKHLEAESPYNTYKRTGLPPGPICIPSIAGLDAVLNHTKTNYLYMCAKEDFSGTHNFEAEYSKHQQNAARYARALNQLGIR